MTVSSYARRTKQALGSVLAQVLNGKLAVVGLSPDGTGLRRLRVALPESMTAKPGMTLGEAAKLTSLQQASISELVSTGVIQRIEDSPPTWGARRVGSGIISGRWTPSLLSRCRRTR